MNRITKCKPQNSPEDAPLFYEARSMSGLAEAIDFVALINRVCVCVCLVPRVYMISHFLRVEGFRRGFQQNRK